MATLHIHTAERPLEIADPWDDEDLGSTSYNSRHFDGLAHQPGIWHWHNDYTNKSQAKLGLEKENLKS